MIEYSCEKQNHCWKFVVSHETSVTKKPSFPIRNKLAWGCENKLEQPKKNRDHSNSRIPFGSDNCKTLIMESLMQCAVFGKTAAQFDSVAGLYLKSKLENKSLTYKGNLKSEPEALFQTHKMYMGLMYIIGVRKDWWFPLLEFKHQNCARCAKHALSSYAQKALKALEMFYLSTSEIWQPIIDLAESNCSSGCVLLIWGLLLKNATYLDFTDLPASNMPFQKNKLTYRTLVESLLRSSEKRQSIWNFWYFCSCTQISSLYTLLNSQGTEPSRTQIVQ